MLQLLFNRSHNPYRCNSWANRHFANTNCLIHLYSKQSILYIDVGTSKRSLLLTSYGNAFIIGEIRKVTVNSEIFARVLFSRNGEITLSFN